MQIKNAIIILEDDCPIRMSIEELKNFSGNVIFTQSKLPHNIAKVVDELHSKCHESGV